MAAVQSLDNSLLELHMLGTGPSECNPNIACITHPNNGGCQCCLSALTSEGKKNKRMNTCAMLRVKPDGLETRPEDIKSILIDCGKTFLTSALEWFPQKGFRKIDALVRMIDHIHSRFRQIAELASSGLDHHTWSQAALTISEVNLIHNPLVFPADPAHLGWTLNGSIQKSVDIYLDRATYDEVAQRYPYLVNTKAATGSGAVPAMNYIIFDEKVPFECHGVTVTPLPVHHGINYAKNEPNICLGFMFNRSIAYLSDVTFIPDSTWKLLLGQINTDEVNSIIPIETQNGSSGTNGHDEGFHGPDVYDECPSRVSATHVTTKMPPPVLILDCQRVWSYTAHYGFPQAVADARRLGATITYFTGFAHETLHTTWESLCEAVEAGERPKNPPVATPGGLARKMNNMAGGKFGKSMPHSEAPEELKEIALCALEDWEGGPQSPIWVRPTFDGHMVAVDEANGTCWDDEYTKEPVIFR